MTLQGLLHVPLKHHKNGWITIKENPLQVMKDPPKKGHNIANPCKTYTVPSLECLWACFAVHGQLRLRPPPKGHTREQTKAFLNKKQFPHPQQILGTLQNMGSRFLLAALVSNITFPSCIPSQAQCIPFWPPRRLLSQSRPHACTGRTCSCSWADLKGLHLRSFLGAAAGEQVHQCIQAFIHVAWYTNTTQL